MASLTIMGRARGARPGRTVAAIALLAVAALAGPGGVATAESGIKSAAAGGGDGAGRPVLADAMLQAEDVPSWLPAGDAEPTDDTHFPEFQSNGGLRGVLRTWHDMDVIGTLVEFIWQFPDADAGASFLDDAEVALSEASSGSVREEPPVSPLADTRYYHVGDGTSPFNAYVYLMRHEDMVSKLYISGRGDGLTEAGAGAIAQAAADRMVKALGDGPAPTTAPSDPPADPADLDTLLSHIPAAVGARCTEDAQGHDAQFGGLAQVVCSQSADASILFTLYDGEGSLNDAFDVASMVAGISGWEPADSCEAGGYEGTWTLGGVEAGRLLCVVQGGTAAITWSHPATGILSTIRQTDADPEAAWQLWLAAGPE